MPDTINTYHWIFHSTLSSSYSCSVIHYYLSWFKTYFFPRNEISYHLWSPKPWMCKGRTRKGIYLYGYYDCIWNYLEKETFIYIITTSETYIKNRNSFFHFSQNCDFAYLWFWHKGDCTDEYMQIFPNKPSNASLIVIL